MLMKTILILLFLLFVWWFARFAHRDGYQGRTPLRSREQNLPTDRPESLSVAHGTGAAGLEQSPVREPFADEPPAASSSLSFRPDGNFRTNVSASARDERVSHTAQRLQTTNDASAEAADFITIAASSGITGDDQQQFVASLLRQIDENNRDITLLSSGVRENDELISRVTRQETQIAELKEQLDTHAAEASSLATGTAVSGDGADALTTARNELAASQTSLAALRAQLAKAQADATKAKTNDLELRRLHSELQSLQQEKNEAALGMTSIEQSSAVPGNAHAAEQSMAQLQADIKQRDQRIAELDARLANQTTGQAAGQSTSQSAGQSARHTTGQTGKTVKSAVKPTVKPVLKPLYTRPPGHDDLKRISGIGPKMEALLNQLGVTTFEQLAGFGQTDIEQVSAALNAFPGRIERDDWVGQSTRFFDEQRSEKNKL